MYDGWGKPDKSEPCDKRLLTIVEKEYGPDSPVLAPVLKNDAAALRALGHKDEADKVDQRLATIRASTMKTN
jgi:hypothetical protein